jgi:hypothetical protein
MDKPDENEVADMAKPRGRPFLPGNTAGSGRPPGSRNKATQAAQDLFGEYAVPLTRKCISLAGQGDRTALKLCIERVSAPCKDTPVEFPLPVVRTVHDLLDAANAIIQAVSQGELTPVEGRDVMTLLEPQRRILEIADIEPRLRAVEEKVAVGGQR